MEKGFVGFFIVVVVSLLLIGGGYWAYTQNFQNIRQIHSYDDCAKAGYPVLASYPGQCNTPDGQHFGQELPEGEKQKLVPSEVQQVDLDQPWKTYVNKDFGFEIKYPVGVNFRNDFGKGGLVSFYRDGLDGKTRNGGISDPIGMNFYKRDYWGVDGMPNVKYNLNSYQALKSDGEVTNDKYTEYYWITADILHRTIRINIEISDDTDSNKKEFLEIFHKMLETFKFTD